MRSEEARLLEAWTTENLEAYGAALRADGDPRGELIAIDLVLAREKSRAIRDALAEEKKALHTSWLGEIGENVETKYGFIEAVRDEHAAILDALDTLAPFMRVLQLWGGRPEIEETLERFAVTPRPFLHTLEATSYRDTEKPMIRAPIGAKLIAATPRMHTLQARGHIVIDDFPHPSVQHVEIDGWDALLALGGTCALPNATSLDYAFHPATIVDREPPPDVIRGGLVQPAGFPKLTTLDLSRNEPREDALRPNCLGGATRLFDVLPKLAILPQVEVLRVPSLRTPAMAAQLQAVRTRMPRLRTLEIARSYLPFVEGPPPVPWLAGDAIRSVDAVVIEIGGEWVRGDLGDAYDVCEREYAQMTMAQRTGWDALWTIVRRCGDNPDQREALARERLHAILETIGSEDHYYWKDVAKKLAEHPDGPLQVRRINTFETPFEREAPKPRIHATSERIAEHERALQEHLDLERLAVYADDLQELGDVRGELIACDLKLAKGYTSDLDYRRDDLHEEIFGSEYHISSKLGFAILDISVWSDDERRRLDRAPEDVMRYLGECELSGPVERLVEQVELLFAEPRPWLRALRVETMGALAGLASCAGAVQARCPILETLELVMDDRHQMFGGLAHPRVRALRITGACALEELGGPWPRVTDLDFAYGVDGEVREPSRVITAKQLPALRTLDLSRNERAYGTFERRRRHQCSFDFYDAFQHFDEAMLAGIVALKLPAPRSDEDVDVIRRVLDRMPRIEQLEIVRRYPHGPHVALAHPTATIIVPPPSSWLPPEMFGYEARLLVEDVKVPLAEAVLAMEEHYAQLPEPARRAWDGLWSRIEQPQFEIGAHVVYEAMDALRVASPYSYQWPEQVTLALHPLAIAERTIHVRRAG
jgi:hypothetical protein